MKPQLRSAGRALDSRRGTVVVLTALALVPLVGVMALVLDGGLQMIERQQVRAAADAAAYAAAGIVARPGGTTFEARTVAQQIASLNGYSTSDVTINIPPTSGPFAGNGEYIEVIVRSDRARLFSAIWGRGTLTARGRAVARVFTEPKPSPSIILLDPSARAALNVAGSARIVTNGGIQVNSSHAEAAIATNMGYTQSTAVNIKGNYWTDSSGKFKITKADGTVDASLTPTTGGSAMKDPLSDLPAPSLAGMLMGGVADPNALPVWMRPPAGTSQVPGYGTYTIKPGYYDGGLELRGGAVVTMQPGIYYMKGGGFTVANGVTVTGQGVMVYVENGAGSFNIQGGGVLRFSPPTTGVYKGITFYQDRGSTRPFNIANGSTTRIEGTLYAAGAKMIYAGGAQYGQDGQLNQTGSRYIVKSLDITNNAFVGITTDPGNVIQTRVIRMVE